MDTQSGLHGELWRGRDVILGCLLGMTTGITSIFFYSSGLFLKPLATEFGWSRGMASLGVLIPMLTIGIISPFSGQLVDRFGAYRMALVSAGGLALSFLLLGIATTGLLSFLVLTFFLAILGNATTPVSYGRFVLANFPRRLGLAYGIVYCGPGLGALLFPSLVNKLLTAYTWRGAYIGLSGLVVAAIPIVAWLLKNQSARDPAEAGATQWKWQLYANKRFMLLALVFLLASIGIFGTIVHLVPMLTDRGLSAADAAQLAGLMGFAVIVGRLITGFLLDRLEANLLAATIFGLSACGVVMLASGNSELILPGALAVGFTIGSELDLAFYLIGRRFPSKHFSSLFGGIMLAVSIGGSAGPLVAGLAYDAAGNYLPWFALAACSMLSASILSLIGRLSVFREGLANLAGERTAAGSKIDAAVHTIARPEH
ncbi:MFS transporter [Bradyrhizobium sp. WSM1253]|uniref:MFS transporter n=1 Tax=Bradyrhizobium sp. WSM1253 TaxID=319003 RepID=UPI00025D160E|nr:MFS transporter [Bradyrhizobium sp. WSM1253]EIG57929.1 cyanate permease [Bradyrhizobium sp. WSM1253]